MRSQATAKTSKKAYEGTSMIDGRELTASIIKRYGFHDTNNTTHRPYGIYTWQSEQYAHVCFDDHPKLGRRCWFRNVVWLQIHIITENLVPVLGSLPYSSIKNTGSGYKVNPIDAGMFSFDIDKYAQGLKENDKSAVEIVRRWLEEQGEDVIPASVDEQKNGIDLVSIKKWEVKSRFSSFPNIFVQLGETNPNGIH